MRSSLWTVALAILLACSQTPKDKTQGPTSASRDAGAKTQATPGDKDPATMPNANFQEQIANKDFESWTGLPADARVDGLGPNVEVGKAYRDGVLGSARTPARYVQARIPGYPELTKLWVRGDALIAIEIELPELSDPKALRAALGKAKLELDSLVPTTGMTMAKANHVYPERGIALRLSTAGDNVTGLWLFVATDASNYQTALAPVLKFRESAQP